MKFVAVSLLNTLFFVSCNSSVHKGGGEKIEIRSNAPTEKKYDPNRGEGKFDENNFKLGKIDLTMAEKGKAISGTKCFSCHKITEERLVGPGWKGVTTRRKAHWIMNFITNPEPMIDKDPELQAQLEICLVRMPNQNLSEDDAIKIVEFMRSNDSAQ